MGAHVGVPAAGVLAIGTPSREVIVDATWAEDGVVRPQRRGAEPHLPVEAGFELFFGEITKFAGVADTHGDFRDFAEPPAANELGAFAEVAENIGTLLAAGLHDALMFAGGFHAAMSLGDRKCQRFFAVDIFARVASFDKRNRMPMIWRRDANRVDVALGKDFSEIGEDAAAFEILFGG